MKRNEVIVHEHKKGVRAVKYNAKPQQHIEPPKPRNPVAKNAGAAIGGGAAGAHKDAKKASQSVRGQKHKNAEMAEGGRYGHRNPDLMSPSDYDRYQQDQMDYDRRAFKRAELQHELGHETNNYAVAIDGRTWKVFASRNHAEAVARTLRNKGKKASVHETGAEPTAEATGDALGTISSTTPDGKVSIKTATGDEIKTDQSALMPGANGTVQMKPDAAGDALKPGAKVVSTEDATDEEMMAPPTDSSSPIPGDNDHDEISKLLVHKLKRLAGL